MSHRGPYIAAAAVVAVIALWLVPGWVAWTIIAVVVGVPVVGYLALDRNQRRRLRNIRRRQIR